jgi:hypothetical protein
VKREAFSLEASRVLPARGAILAGQGIPPQQAVSDEILHLVHDAIDLYSTTAAPAGIFMEVSPLQFEDIFRGEGLNHEDAPVLPIARQADALALYAVTIGESVSREIAEKFAQNDFAIGCMLDSAASEGAEILAQHAERLYERTLPPPGRSAGRPRIMRFSPGYCGWHVSGQKKLFAALKPEEIGITLTPSCLMKPLKSISGVIIAGDVDIFQFGDAFAFCGECSAHVCRERLAALVHE